MKMMSKIRLVFCVGVALSLLFVVAAENVVSEKSNASESQDEHSDRVKNQLHNLDEDEIDTTAATTTTELTPDPIRSLLLVSTLDGSLTALDRLSGQLRWISKDEPMIRAPGGKIDSLPKPPFFLPDPRTGSLYVLGRHGQLKKLPFTIPQLVSMAPCRSTEGLLYTGRKLDMWLSLNPLTGEKYEMKSNDDLTCPLAATTSSVPDMGSGKSKTVLIGKSEYTISMLDGPRKWNVTFHDYSSVEMNPQLMQDYDLLHFTSPSTGTILTYDRESSQLLWQTDLQSPVIALYTIDCASSSLVSVPFTAIASETLNRIKAPAAAHNSQQLLPTLYVGECPYGLYAVPSLVDNSVYKISSSNRDLTKLLEHVEGPLPNRLGGKDQPTENQQADLDNNSEVPPADSVATDLQEAADYLIFGHYEVPESSNIHSPKQIAADPSDPSLPSSSDYTENNNPLNESDRVIKPPFTIPAADGSNSGAPEKSTPNVFPPMPHVPIKETKLKDRPSFVAFTTAVVTILVMSAVILFWTKYRNPGGVTKKPQFLSSDGILSVGKISYDPSAILGKGCEGTFVYKGKFEDRSVAVKRILPECFAFADREVDLLKESDQHPNVIRYFCTESDGQFRYIALELCSATVHDWIEGRFTHGNISPLTILKEATDGLAHLHSLRIVHRDIKPANVLLSICATTQNVKAMISDFGLCKKLMNGRVSFSRRSGGIPGTEGWIAPELMKDESDAQRVTHAVDIFSLGCVFYYVLSNGSHPFGDAFQRQSNIISGESDLGKLTETVDNVGMQHLIKAMISKEAEQRPPPSAILMHPIFWTQEKILGFFLDVSDRVEKEDEQLCPLLRSLESDPKRLLVVRQDWRDHICPEVALDLRKYRTYKGQSIRDLLRALRNKKNHYRELTPQAQASLGEIPGKFVTYWISRFPALLPYTWSKCEKIKREAIFSKYYPRSFTFFPQMSAQETIDSIEIGEQPTPIGLEFMTDAVPPSSITVPNENSSSENSSPEKLFPPGPRQVISKNFWKSRNQQNPYRYHRNRRGGGGGNSVNQNLGMQEKSPVRTSNLADTTDNWRNPTNS